jgi:hypothetical protein
MKTKKLTLLTFRFCLLTALLTFIGCDETSRHIDDTTGASVSIIDRVTINGAARTQLKVSLGDNQSGYVSAFINGSSLFSPEYLTTEQASNFDKHLVCDVVSLGGSSLTMRCGWTQYDPTRGVWRGALSGDWGASRLVSASLSDTLRIAVTIGDRNKGDMSLYISGDGYLY